MGKRKKRRQSSDAETTPNPPKAPDRINNPFADALRGLRAEDPEGRAGKSTPPTKATTGAPSRHASSPAPKPPDPSSERAPEAAAANDFADYPYEDRAAFHQAFAGVKPLGAERRAERIGAVRRTSDHHASPRPTAPASTRAADEHARAQLASLVTGGLRFDVQRDMDGYVEAEREDAPRGTLRALMRKGVAPEASVDLHGLRADDAARRVEKAVRESCRAGRRILLIVHGKGQHSEGGVGVLADRVHEVLTAGAAAPFVLAFASAPRELGGTGALLVALRA